jgi:hypothetical protein
MFILFILCLMIGDYFFPQKVQIGKTTVYSAVMTFPIFPSGDREEKDLSEVLFRL